MNIAFDNTYIRLPERLYARQPPTPVASPSLIRVNHGLATLLGIDPTWLESDAGVSTLAGNRIPEGAQPLAAVYAGHQFGAWNPQLGDGRAVLLGEVLGTDGERYDIQLKGAGQTPWSRMGDGRAPLGPVLREYILSEAMHALGVPTSRALAAVATGEPVHREETLPGAVIARVARSHIRIGTLQYLAAREDKEALAALVNHLIDRHYPEAREHQNPVQGMFEQVCDAQARLVVRWQSLGFIHGVMNTDNMLLCGETIDYGPCAFMDSYRADAVYSSIDHGGRYAFCNQPAITHWNLACLGQALLPVLADSEGLALELAQEILGRFPAMFLTHNLQGMRAKLGLRATMSGVPDRAEEEALLEDAPLEEILAKDFLDLLESTGSDFTLAFRRLAEMAGEPLAASIGSLFEFPEAFAPWLARWQAQLERQFQAGAQKSSQQMRQGIQAAMLAVNPALIPRNHLVEEIITAAVGGDLAPFHQLVDVLQNPFDYPAEKAAFLEGYAKPPTPEQVVRQTFCGT